MSNLIKYGRTLRIHIRTNIMYINLKIKIHHTAYINDVSIVVSKVTRN